MLNELYQSLDPVAFSIGPFQARWYGIAYILGFVCVGLVAALVARRWKLRFEPYDVLLLVVYCAVGIIVGARIGYCLIYGNGYYLAHPLEFLAFNQGGMSFHGGLVGVVVAGVVYSRVYHVPFGTVADLVVCGAPAGLFFGRCANFVNGELYGAPTASPLGVDFTGSGVLYQPSQLYEACLEGVVLLVVMALLARRADPPRPRGTFLGTFLLCYGVFRFLIEFVRLPDAQIGYFFGTWGTMGQALCVPMVVAGVVLLAWARRRQLPQQGLPLPPA